MNCQLWAEVWPRFKGLSDGPCPQDSGYVEEKDRAMDHPSRAQTGDDTGGLAPNCLSLPGLGEYGEREASPSRSLKS